MSAFDDINKKYQDNLAKLIALVAPRNNALDRAREEIERMDRLLKPYGGPTAAEAVLKAIEEDEVRKKELINSSNFVQQQLENLIKAEPVIEHLPLVPVPRQDISELHRRLAAAQEKAKEKENIEELKAEIISLKALIRKLISSEDDK